MDIGQDGEIIQSSRPGKLYYAGFALFIAASAILAIWAFVTLALAG